MPELLETTEESAPKKTETGRYFRRFTSAQRTLHAVLFTTFLGLAATGLPLRFSESLWARGAARFVGGGMRTVPAETRRVRLATCEACEHHTGTRCRLCGCFTAVKTQLPHERCPVAKWPV